MRKMHEWPGEWTKVAPQVDDHPPGAELVWAVRGEPFTRPILARSNVGTRVTGFAAKAEKFVYVELMSEAFHGVHAGHYGFFDKLEWCGPLVLPNAKVSGAGTASAGLPGYAAGGNGERK